MANVNNQIEKPVLRIAYSVIPENRPNIEQWREGITKELHTEVPVKKLPTKWHLNVLRN